LSDLKLDEMKIFGKTNKSWIVNTDFFNDYNFKNKKLKPAYFNTADVKVPYEASRLQYLQKQNISSMFTKEVKLDDSLLILIFRNSHLYIGIVLWMLQLELLI
jgi:hypothetical protein